MPVFAIIAAATAVAGATYTIKAGEAAKDAQNDAIKKAEADRQALLDEERKRTAALDKAIADEKAKQDKAINDAWAIEAARRGASTEASKKAAGWVKKKFSPFGLWINREEVEAAFKAAHPVDVAKAKANNSVVVREKGTTVAETTTNPETDPTSQRNQNASKINMLFNELASLKSSLGGVAQSAADTKETVTKSNSDTTAGINWGYVAIGGAVLVLVLLFGKKLL